MTRVEAVRATAPDVSELIAAHRERSLALYPTDSSHVLTPVEMDESDFLLFAIRVAGRAVSMGGIRPLGRGTGEIKSMYTDPAHRGRGHARRILEKLIAEARSRAWRSLCLETGSDAGSASARRLYTGSGFVECPPFGDYGHDPLSVFLRYDL